MNEHSHGDSENVSQKLNKKQMKQVWEHETAEICTDHDSLIFYVEL
jgi:hypothetical protein